MSTLSNIHESTARQQWQILIDRTLGDWLRDPSQLGEDGIPAASIDTIRLAMQLAERLSEQGARPPTRIVRDAHAGIVLERESGRSFDSYRVSAEGAVEYCEFEDCRLVKRTSLPLSDF